MRDDLVENLKTGLAFLTNEERLVLTLYYYEDLNTTEIAEVISIPINTVGILLSQAQSKMKPFTTIFADIDRMGEKGLSIMKGYSSV